MPKPRKHQIALSETPYYHLISRCVRRAFLCGSTETYNFEHRRRWILERLTLLTKMFAIDVAAFALMSNHYHLVVRVDVLKASGWGCQEIARRWQILFKLPASVARYLDGALNSDAENLAMQQLIETWRARLTDISWFMRCLNEYIARQANTEDQCSGRFWEGRFKSQALLDEKALLTAMAYVDLNPVRAGMATTPTTSNYTSIQQRLGAANHSAFDGELLPFTDTSHQNNKHIPYHFIDYIELIHWTSQHIKPDQQIVRDKKSPALLAHVGIPQQCWLKNCRHLESQFYQVVGPTNRLKQFCQKLGLRWLHGQTACRRSFG